MNKNIAIACGLGDLFMFFTKLPDFFTQNPEYDSVKFWAWVHSPSLARELCSISGLPVSLMSVEDMVRYLKEELLSEAEFERAAPHLITQHARGVGVEKYVRFMQTFFTNIEEWIHMSTYNKYSSMYPFVLNHGAPSLLSGEPYIVVHPFSTTVATERPERTWSPDCWFSLFAFINKYTSTKIVILGSENDIIEEVKRGTSFETRNVVDLRGKLSLTESINMVYGAKAVFGINTLTTQIAEWAGIPTYVQWFVQEQLIETHTPPNYEKLGHIFIERAKYGVGGLARPSHPSVNEVWDTVRAVLDYANCPLYTD